MKTMLGISGVSSPGKYFQKVICQLMYSGIPESNTMAFQNHFYVPKVSNFQQGSFSVIQKDQMNFRQGNHSNPAFHLVAEF